jgi:hypothetical protein
MEIPVEDAVERPEHRSDMVFASEKECPHVFLGKGVLPEAFLGENTIIGIFAAPLLPIVIRIHIMNFLVPV